MIEGQISDYTGTAVLLDSTPTAQWMPEDRGYDADWLKDWPFPIRNAMLIPSGRQQTFPCDLP